MNYPRKPLAARAKQGNYSAGRGHRGSQDTEILSKSDWDGTAGGAGGQQLDTSRFGSSWGGLPGAAVSSPHLPCRVRGQGDPRGKPTLVLGWQTLRFEAGNIAFCYKNWSVSGHKRLPPVRPEQAVGLQEMLSERLLARRAWQTRGRAFLNSSSPLTLPSVAASQTLVLSQTLLPWRPWLLWQVSRSHSPTNRSLPAAPEICNPPDFLFY